MSGNPPVGDGRGRCDGCLRDVELLVTAVCVYHWHYFCQGCLPLVRRPASDARPLSHRGYDNALRAPFVRCVMEVCDHLDEATRVLIALRRIA